MLYNHQFKESFSRVLLRNYADWVLNNVHNEEAFKLLDSCLDRGETSARRGEAQDVMLFQILVLASFICVGATFKRPK